MLLFAIVLAIIANFQVFDTVYVLTQGGPVESTSTMVWFIWERLFQFQQTGQGYAAAVILLGIILVLTAISFWFLGARAGARKAGLMAVDSAHLEVAGRPDAARGLRAGRAAPPERSTSRRGSLAYAVLTLFAVIALGPFLYLLSPSLRHSYDLLTFPPQWLPKSLYLGNFGGGAPPDELPALGAQHLHLRDVGHPDHARHRHARRLRVRADRVPRAQDPLRVVISSPDDPDGSDPRPALHHRLEPPGWTHAGVNTYPGLVLPMVCSPLGVFMMRQFMSTLPEGLVEAARLDGASEFQIFRKIVLPLMKPADRRARDLHLHVPVDELPLAARDHDHGQDEDAHRRDRVAPGAVRDQLRLALGRRGDDDGPDRHRLPDLPEVVRAGVDGGRAQAVNSGEERGEQWQRS